MRDSFVEGIPSTIMTSTDITIGAGNTTSLSGAGSVTGVIDPLYAVVALEDLVLIAIQSPGAGDAFGLGVSLVFI